MKHSYDVYDKGIFVLKILLVVILDYIFTARSIIVTLSKLHANSGYVLVANYCTG